MRREQGVDEVGFSLCEHVADVAGKLSRRHFCSRSLPKPLAAYECYENMRGGAEQWYNAASAQGLEGSADSYELSAFSQNSSP